MDTIIVTLLRRPERRKVKDNRRDNLIQSCDWRRAAHL